MTKVLTHIDQLTPSKLTSILTRADRLLAGYVVRVAVTLLDETRVSLHYRIHFDLSRDAEVMNLPTSLFLRLSNPAFPYNSDHITTFYNTIIPRMKDSGWQESWWVADCLDAAWSVEQTIDHLLLEDLSETHFIAESHLPPSYQLAEQLIDAFAGFHAFWWEHPDLGRGIGEHITQQAIDESHASFRAEIERMRDRYQPDLSPEQFAILNQPNFGWHPLRRKRVVKAQGVTLIHHDPHPGNIFYPRNPAHHSIKLIDWQSWRVCPATDDLAYLIAFHWVADVRRQWEEPLLRRYHQRLVDLGVHEYSWDNLIFDYRVSIVRFLMTMVRYWRQESNRARARTGLQAFVDWECDKVLIDE